MNDPLVGLMILAAGASTRMGTPKQLLPFQGRSLLRHTADVAIASQCYPIIVVLGAHAERIKPEVDCLALHIVENKRWAEGMGTSIQAGIAQLSALSQNIEAVVIVLCDQPFVSSQLIDQIVEAYRSTHKAIVASEYAGIPGVPALFSHTLFAELMKLDASVGAKHIIQKHSHNVYRVPFSKGAIDIDTPKDYEHLQEM